MRTSTSSRTGPQAPEREAEPISSWSNAASTAIGAPAGSGAAACAISAASPACVAERLSSRPEAKNSPLAPKTAGGCVSAMTTS